jgi:uncharacterized cupredoxin-like copper-binding protein
MDMTLSSLRRAAAIAAVAAAGAGLAACGSGDDSSASSSKTASSSSSSKSSSAGSSSLTVAASEKGGLSFTKKTLSAKAGTVTITMANPNGDKLPHAVSVEGNGVDKDGAIAQPGSKSTVSVKLKPGEYQFYCPVSGHRQAGMEGTLTVQ